MELLQNVKGTWSLLGNYRFIVRGLDLPVRVCTERKWCQEPLFCCEFHCKSNPWGEYWRFAPGRDVPCHPWPKIQSGRRTRPRIQPGLNNKICKVNALKKSWRKNKGRYNKGGALVKWLWEEICGCGFKSTYISVYWMDIFHIYFL